MSNVVSLRAFKLSKLIDTEELAYQAKLLDMSKQELLEEMVRFQEERKAAGVMDLAMMTRGKHLFKMLYEQADSAELKILSLSYRKHLEYEIAAAKETLQGLK